MLTGRGRHEIVIRWQLAPGSEIQAADGAVQVTGPAGTFSVGVMATGPMLRTAQDRSVATGFGRVAEAPALTYRIDAGLPVNVVTTWSRVPDYAAGEARS